MDLRSTSFDAQPTWVPPPGEAGPGGPLTPGERLGRFVVLYLVGRGAMGEVYAAYDPELDRKVAIKQLHAGPAGSAARRQLIHEARAAARISHPNVVTVFDAFDGVDCSFLAMEFVEGVSLRTWLESSALPWQSRLETLLAAGRGLAAAHHSGLVHRDFKPDNVFVGEGSVKVGDFGLARITEAARDATLPAVVETDPGLSRGGAIVGTPAYMSPEQLRGASVDARTDQFSFCVATFEALYGQRPFAGDSLESIARSIESNALVTVTAAGVPAALRRVLARGLLVEPAQRYPDLDALLAALEQAAHSARRVRTWALGAALCAAAAGVAMAAWPAPVCSGISNRLTGTWDPARQRAVEASFQATGAPHANAAFQEVRRTLDTYAAGWLTQQTGACEATRVRGDQSDRVLSLRSACLDRRLSALGALVDTLAHADAQVLERADAAARKLDPLEACANTSALLAGTPLPTDARTQREVARLDSEVARAQALIDSGRFESGVGVAREASAAAATLGFRPVEARAGLVLGRAEQASAHFDASRAALWTALWAAEAARDDRVAAEAWTELTYVAGTQFEKRPENEQWSRHAAAALERLGGDPGLEAELNERTSLLFENGGDFSRALDRATRAFELKQRLYGDDDVRVANALFQRASVFTELARFDEAVADAERAMGVVRNRLGPDHPTTARAEGELGRVLLRASRTAAAAPHLEASLDIFTRALGPTNPRLVVPLCNLAGVRRDQGRADEALALLTQALQLEELRAGDASMAVAQLLANRADLLGTAGRHREAAEALERARSIVDNASGASPVLVAVVTGNQANELLALQRFADARAAYERALAVREKVTGPQHPALAYYLTGIGQALLGLKTPGQALAPLERALSLREAHPDAPRLLADTQLALAHALVASGHDRERARRLAATGARAYAALAPAALAEQRGAEAFVRSLAAR